MFVIYDQPNQRIPIKVWLKDKKDIEQDCLTQAYHLSMLPFAAKHIALMPDTHSGYGMPIGGVLAADGVIIPNAVGVDIGCGMCYFGTNIPVKILKETSTPSGALLQMVIGTIMRNIPVGFSHHKKPQPCHALDNAKISELTGIDELMPEIDAGYYQVGTLGGGNHFIEIQEDQDGYVAVMLHSGSRNFGYKICKYFNNKAKELNKKWFSSVPPEWDLAFLPVDSDEGQQYIAWMNLALEFASENRDRMLRKVREILYGLVKKYTGFTGIEETPVVNCHHNYAALEHFNGKNLWIHRKGAIRARVGDVGIIPGAMGSKSYIVRGLGNPESFNSCSHGAGRNSSRKKAKEIYDVQSVIEDLKCRGVVVGKNKKDDITEECRWAYKDIDYVMSQQTDLVQVIKELNTIGVVKG